MVHKMRFISMRISNEQFWKAVFTKDITPNGVGIVESAGQGSVDNQMAKVSTKRRDFFQCRNEESVTVGKKFGR